MSRLLSFASLIAAILAVSSAAQSTTAPFNVHSAHSGKWSDAGTWREHRVPKGGDYVQIGAGDTVTYDVNSDQAIRMIHVAGKLQFARDRSTRLDVGLIKIQAGTEATEEGFNCDAHAFAPENADPRAVRPTLELGTTEAPIPAGVTATIRLVYFPGTDKETLPAILNCAGRWDVHGAPLSRTWVKLGVSVKPGDTTVALSEPVTGWRVGDHVIVTASRHTYEPHRPAISGAETGETEQRTITTINGASLTLDRPLTKPHFGEGEYRSEVANLSRNVMIESADPNGVRGHTMYHRSSQGGISYAEFRHLGKEGVLGKYSIHFHLVRDSMRGSGVIGASIWDSRNRWITIHGTDYLLVRDCVGYQSIGHGYFLEDGTEQYNVLDRNLAVEAFDGRRLPKQVLPFDANDGAGFWWANGRNTLTRNVSCECQHYGYHYEVAKQSNFNPVLDLITPDGSHESRDIRTVPFLRFEANESHTEGLYSFNFGEDVNPGVRGDKQHPFIARDLLAWQTHYVLRPNLQFFLMDGLKIKDGVYGVYHPDYDAHVYRNIYLDNVNSEPINRGHDDDSIQYGDFTYENLTLENCRIGRDPLIQLTCTSPKAGVTGHFKNLVVKNSTSHDGKVVDLGGGPRIARPQNGVAYYFHDYPSPGQSLRVVSAHLAEMQRGAEYRTIDGFTGPDVRAAVMPEVPFPQLLQAIDDLPPATMITSVHHSGGKVVVRGVSQDNGEIASVAVNGHPAKITAQRYGVAEWEIALEAPANAQIRAAAKDRAGNTEKMAHEVNLR